MIERLKGLLSRDTGPKYKVPPRHDPNPWEVEWADYTLALAKDLEDISERVDEGDAEELIRAARLLEYQAYRTDPTVGERHRNNWRDDDTP